VPILAALKELARVGADGDDGVASGLDHRDSDPSFGKVNAGPVQA